MVGADLDVMRRDSAAVRNGKPTHLISLREDPSAASVAEWVREQVRARALQTRVRTRSSRSSPGPARAAGRSCRWCGRAASSPSAARGRRPCTWSPRRSARSVGTTPRSGWWWRRGRRLTVRSVAAAIALPARGRDPAVGAADHRDRRRRARPAPRADRRRRPGPPRRRAVGRARRRRRAHRTEQVLLGRTGEEPGRWTGTHPGRAGAVGRCCTPRSASGPGAAAWLPPVAPRAYASTVHIGDERRRGGPHRGRTPSGCRCPAAGWRRRGEPSCTGWCAAAEALTVPGGRVTGMSLVVRARRVVLPDGERAAAVHTEDGRITAVTAFDDAPVRRRDPRRRRGAAARAGRQPRARQRTGAHRVGGLRHRDPRRDRRRRHHDRRHAPQLDPADDHRRRVARETRDGERPGRGRRRVLGRRRAGQPRPAPAAARGGRRRVQVLPARLRRPGVPAAGRRRPAGRARRAGDLRRPAHRPRRGRRRDRGGAGADRRPATPASSPPGRGGGGVGDRPAGRGRPRHRGAGARRPPRRRRRPAAAARGPGPRACGSPSRPARTT